MKKLLVIILITGFVGLAFAFSPSRINTTQELDGITLLEDTTKTKKTTKKKDCSKKSCCKKPCSSKKTKKSN